MSQGALGKDNKNTRVTIQKYIAIDQAPVAE